MRSKLIGSAHRRQHLRSQQSPRRWAHAVETLGTSLHLYTTNTVTHLWVKKGYYSSCLLLARSPLALSRLGADVLVVLLEGGEVFVGLGELALLHAEVECCCFDFGLFAPGSVDRMQMRVALPSEGKYDCRWEGGGPEYRLRVRNIRVVRRALRHPQADPEYRLRVRSIRADRRARHARKNERAPTSSRRRRPPPPPPPPPPWLFNRRFVNVNRRGNRRSDVVHGRERYHGVHVGHQIPGPASCTALWVRQSCS